MRSLRRGLLFLPLLQLQIESITFAHIEKFIVSIMTNKEIAKAFNELAGLMELHEQNSFKIKSYQNAYRFLRKVSNPLNEMTEKEIGAIPGVGKAIVGKIQELTKNGSMATLEKWRAETPEGVRQMLNVKGFGPKKIKVVWQELGIETIGELLHACTENRLVAVKGFGQKTQKNLEEQLEYHLQSSNKFHLATLLPLAEEYLAEFHLLFPKHQSSLSGKIRREYPIVDQIDLITTTTNIETFLSNSNLELTEQTDSAWNLKAEKGFKVVVHKATNSNYGSRLFQTSHDEDFKALFGKADNGKQKTESAIFKSAGFPVILPALRELEGNSELDPVGKRALDGWSPDLVEMEDIKGVVHAHSTYSDGINSIKEMAERCQQLGYEYLALTDHSQSAFYADGLKVDRLYNQWDEIDELNKNLKDFKIFRGIESDILSSGGLDYEDEILMEFDFIIASVHSNLKMDREKATKRIVTAIENPYTSILGHPTGRLLLARKGYPIDYKKVIDACSDNGVAIEINANPLRLDLDWRWIPYALEQDVMIAINPDAHSTGGIEDIRWGLSAARKAGLTNDQSLCSLDASEFEDFCRSRI